jgi:prevent-host-death family protein
MPDVTATEAARRFSDLLDAVEHEGSSFTILRRGKAIAYIEPIARGRGADVKELLRSHRPDAVWADELAELRELVEIDWRR